jgi:hypothetical protein
MPFDRFLALTGGLVGVGLVGSYTERADRITLRREPELGILTEMTD